MLNNNDHLYVSVFVSISINCAPGGGVLASVTLLTPHRRGNMFSPALVCLSVCLCVTTITETILDGFVPNLRGGSYGEREDQVCVSLRSVEGCGSNGQKTS